MLIDINGKRGDSIFMGSTHLGIVKDEFYSFVVISDGHRALMLKGDVVIIDAMNSFVSDFESEEYNADELRKNNRR